jgi:hypothetical protein
VVALVIAPVTLGVAAGAAQADSGPDVVVTNCNAAGAGSLSDAVTNATEGTTITFDMAPACSTIILTSTIDVGRTLTIEGPGADDLAVSGDNAVQVFDIGSTDASISGLTIEDGNATDGGGIENHGTLTVTDSTVSGNSATGDGGGIDNLGILTFSGTLSGNSAADGGGIYNDYENGGSTADLTMTGALSDNTASVDGGGLYNFEGTAAVGDTTVSDNTVTGLSGAGGGVFNIGTLDLSASTVSGNSANQGGGIDDGSALQLTADTLSGNTATAAGGGIFNGTNATTGATATTIADNSASQGGGISNAGLLNLAETAPAASPTAATTSMTTARAASRPPITVCRPWIPSWVHCKTMAARH